MALREQLKILVVDDTSTSRGLISQALDSIGIDHVTTATSAQSAFSAMLRRPVHIAISDYLMPGMNGLELLKLMRETPQTKRIGFILITGRPTDQMIEVGKKLGMNNFLEKPFDAGKLQTSIEQIVGRL